MSFKVAPEGFQASLILSLATFFAIILPGKYWYHYYLLLLPTSVVVINYALVGVKVPVIGRGAIQHGRASRLGRKTIALGSLSFVLVYGLFLMRSTPPHNPYNETTTLLLPEERSQGVHLYGWSKTHVYGSYGTYPFNPKLDMFLALSLFSGDLAAYNQAIKESLPPYIIDLAAVGKADLLQSKVKPLDELKGHSMSSWVNNYKLIRSGTAGYVYKRTDPKSVPLQPRSGA